MNLVYRALSRTSALTVVAFWATVPAWSATTRHVWPDSPAPAPPYADWTTAAHVIQDAVDAAEAGDLVLVTNGVYATGGQAVAPATLTNRVAVTKPLRLASVNGPQATIIQGAKTPGGGNGDGAVRCVYLADGASLSGFTLTNGATRSSSVGWPSVEHESYGGGVWCASTHAVLINCVLTGNSAWYGGGAYRGTLNDCTLAGNRADVHGGGAYGNTLNNCTLTGNSARYHGGGTEGSTLNGCALTGNSAQHGGGACSGTLNNCTLTGNSAEQGGGVCWSTLDNCVVYFNSAGREGPNYSGATLNCCCTTPLPAEGQGNLSVDPQLASASYLSAASPCRGAGSAEYATGVDLDGEAWATPPAIGCDEYYAGTATGILSVRIAAAVTNVVVGYPVNLTGLTEGRTSASAWEFGDGETVANQPYTVHAWAAPGDYGVVWRAYNDSHPQGVSATVTVQVVAAVHYVAAESPQPRAPYTSWATAATNIQDAVDAATVTGALVLVTNGTYATGGKAVPPTTLTNRVAVTKPLRLLSVNGPQATIIQGAKAPGGGNGDGAVRCVYLADGASLSGFTLTNGATRLEGETRGGGAWCASTNAVLSNCVLTGNSAWEGGGGAYRGTLNNCTLTGNSASSGGGAAEGALNNCILTGNSAREAGGGVSWSTLNNCVLTGNSAVDGGGAAAGTLHNCTLAGNRAGRNGGGACGSILSNCTLTGNGVWTYSGGGGDGGGAYACTLNNCTLNGNGAWSGGGAAGGTLNNCTLTGNGAGYGGGAAGGTLNNCILTRNTAGRASGGASDCILNNCTVVGNSTRLGMAGRVGAGGTSGGTLNNCILYGNTLEEPFLTLEDDYSGGTLNYCCATPLPTNGVGNIANAPRFVDEAGGNLRLQSNSPCINAGNNAYAPGNTDLDGRPRVVNGTVDMGAYEFQGADSAMFYAWLQRHGLPTDGSADFADPDTDGLNTWQEWRCQTDPTNALSVLRLLSATPAGTGVIVSWPGVDGVTYFLERSPDLGASPPFTPLATNLSGPTGTHTFTDTNAAALPSGFYRVGVGP